MRVMIMLDRAVCKTVAFGLWGFKSLRTHSAGDGCSYRFNHLDAQGITRHANVAVRGGCRV